MSIERVAINASPLITLYRANLHVVLPLIFPEILVPVAVWAEVVSHTHEDPATKGLPSATWAKKVTVSSRPEVEAWNLGAGETSLLSLAFADKSVKVILDDRAARRCATVFGISAIGTAGIVVIAKRRGLIPSVEQALRQLQTAGLWISDTLISQLAMEDR